MSRRKLTRLARLQRNMQNVAHHKHYHRAHGFAYLVYYGIVCLQDHGVHLVVASALLVFVGFNLVAGTNE